MNFKRCNKEISELAGIPVSELVDFGVHVKSGKNHIVDYRIKKTIGFLSENHMRYIRKLEMIRYYEEKKGDSI